MKFLRLLPLIALTVLPLRAQEKGTWSPVSNTARNITGEIMFTNTKLVINFAAFTFAQIRTITPEEASALFNADTPGKGNLYRVEISADQKLLHKNTLCGSQPTDWVITYVTGKTMQVAFFSEQSIPTLTMDALKDSQRLCGIFAYKR